MKSLLLIGLILAVSVVSTYGQMDLPGWYMLSMLNRPSANRGQSGAGTTAQGGSQTTTGRRGGGAFGGLSPLYMFNPDLMRDLLFCNMQGRMFGRGTFGRILSNRCRWNAFN